MPICTRNGFYNAASKNKNEMFQDNEEVFFCEVTKEIFRDYEDYFRHVMAINSTVWQCEATGKDNLTYAEALKSERKARKKLEMFKDSLRPPAMLVIDNAKQSSLKLLSALTFRFLRRRFFINEEVQLTQKSSTHYTIIEILTSDGSKGSNNETYENTESLQYKLRSLGKKPSETVVPYDKVRRQRFEFTLENLQMFIKNNVVRIDGILRPDPNSYKKYVTDRQISFQSIFIGKMPFFTPAKARKPNEVNDGKKQPTLNKYLLKNGEAENERSNKPKSLKEEMERVRREKQQQLLEQERLRAEKRAKLLERIENECTALLTKTDDLERTDQRRLPDYAPVQTYIPDKFISDAFMLREFMHTYVGLLSGIEVFRGNLSFCEMTRALTTREVAGPLSDILLIFLGTIFDLQREEEEECAVDYSSVKQMQEPQCTMALAAKAHHYAKRHFAFKLNELPLDALTLSEVLRLHFLSSGAIVKNKRAEKWRIMYRNGYCSSEDPGLALRMKHPYILKALKLYTVYQLPIRDILRILRCLMDQILTYSGPINVIEERMEQTITARQELRNLHILENQRLTKVQAMKKSMTNECYQQLMEDDVKNDEEKRKLLQEKLDKKMTELLTQSDRQHKKYEQQVAKFNETIFNHLVYLGMDRAYRKYYVLESMPGIFIEHAGDCMDNCLLNPPKNRPLHPELTAHNSNLPKTRQGLRAYLLRMYNEEEKKANIVGTIDNKTKNNASLDVAQENKENELNGQVNGIGLVNGHHDSVNKTDTDDTPLPPPTQYQLFMCTGDPRNCIVHNDLDMNRQRWSYLYKSDDLEALFDSLNPLGSRECELREQLATFKSLLLEHMKQCPNDFLTIEAKHINRFKNIMMTETSRKYSNSNFNFPVHNSDLNEVMYSALVERILQFESEIYTGDLGRLKVKDMEKWRTDLINGQYDAQAKLQWGPPKYGHIGHLAVNGTESEHKLESGEKEEDSENEADDDGQDDGMVKYAGKAYHDPGEALGDTEEIESEDSADDDISLHDSESLRSHVKQLASGLLQVEQAIERRFLKEPFGAAILKDKELQERKQQTANNRLRQWEVSLMESTSYSQVFLHLTVLNDCIIWARSTNKSNCMVCRRGSDPEKMLLCDECNGGTHMFCMKPKMKTVPEGNWYCKRCVARLGLENENDKKQKRPDKRRKRTFLVDDDASDTSSITSDTKITKKVPGSGSSNASGSGERRNKRLRSQDIEAIVEQGEDDEDEEGAMDNDQMSDEVKVVGVMEEEDAEIEIQEGKGNVISEESSNVDEDESVCNVCSYDGSDLSCSQCKNSYHLECINLKRQPRYNFVCKKCKPSTDGSRKRKIRANDSSSESENDEYEEDETPLSKRKRSERQRYAHTTATTSIVPESGNSGRRSFRRTGENLPLNSSALYELLKKVMKDENAWPFLRPVSQAEVPDYYDIIKNPMDFAKVKSKLNMGSYQINEEVLKDIELIFNNCDEYNVKGNEIYQAGAALEKHVMKLCSQLNLPFKPSDMNSED
uniref:Bromodomain adjacent to zinc finger domain protein 1A n=1 Tax=Glossina pallidipes TaxID=7398 RepID=A0A1B0AGK0_GLOPL